MLPSTAADVTYVYSCLRLRDQNAEEGRGDDFVQWDAEDGGEETST
jgi:hypothetical protein